MEVWKDPIEFHIYLSYDEVIRDLANGGLKSNFSEPEYEAVIGKFVLKATKKEGRETKWYGLGSMVQGLKISKKGFESLLKQGFYSLSLDRPEDTCQRVHISIRDHPKRYKRYTREVI